jgi:hypothetical protein
MFFLCKLLCLVFFIRNSFYRNHKWYWFVAVFCFIGSTVPGIQYFLRNVYLYSALLIIVQTCLQHFPMCEFYLICLYLKINQQEFAKFCIIRCLHLPVLIDGYHFLAFHFPLNCVLFHTCN